MKLIDKLAEEHKQQTCHNAEPTPLTVREAYKAGFEKALELAAEKAFCEDTYIGDGEYESWNVNKESILNIKDEEV